MGLTLVEKIAGRHADGLAPGTVVRSGDFISIRPRHVMTHDNTGAVIPKFKHIGATTIADSAQPVFAIDHDIQNTSPENLAKYAKIEERREDACALPKLRETGSIAGEFRTKCFWSAMSPRIAFIRRSDDSSELSSETGARNTRIDANFLVHLLV